MKIYVTVNEETGTVEAFYTKKEAQRENQPGTEIHEVDLTRPVFLVSTRPQSNEFAILQTREVFRTMAEADEYRVYSSVPIFYHITEIRGY